MAQYLETGKAGGANGQDYDLVFLVVDVFAKFGEEFCDFGFGGVYLEDGELAPGAKIEKGLVNFTPAFWRADVVCDPTVCHGSSRSEGFVVVLVASEPGGKEAGVKFDAAAEREFVVRYRMSDFVRHP